jgi:hypothetical protein
MQASWSNVICFDPLMHDANIVYYLRFLHLQMHVLNILYVLYCMYKFRMILTLKSPLFL